MIDVFIYLSGFENLTSNDQTNNSYSIPVICFFK
jgi:hypothetical protein